MDVQPAFRMDLLDAWLNSVATVVLQAVDDTYSYNPAHDGIGDLTGLAGSPVDVDGVGTSLVGGQVWLTYDGVPIVFDDLPPLVTIQGLWLIADGGLVGFIDRRADGSPISFVTTGGDYTVSFPNGYLLRM